MQIHVSPEMNRLLNAAAELSLRRRQFYVGVEHLFEAVIDSIDALPSSITHQYKPVLAATVREMARAPWKGHPPEGVTEVFQTPRCARTLAEAEKLAQRYHEGPATVALVLLMALLADAHSAPSRAMDRIGSDRGPLIAALRGALIPAGNAPGKAATPDNAEKASPNANHLLRDLSQLAADGKLEPAIAREHEIFQVLQILARKNKNNVMLVGDAGVGKTQIVEGIAVAGANGGMRGLAAPYRILELNLAALMAGTQYRGAFEQKLLDLLEELKKDPHAVLFIDEVHLVMGAGATGGDSMDLANLLKPALARGEIRCIGATTMNEYRRFVEKDPAVERRFQMVRIDPLSEEGTRRVLDKLRPALESHHGLTINPKALDAAVTLTARYMPNRAFPDKAIDVLDQACARQRLKAIAMKNATAAGGTSPACVTPHDIRKVISQLTAVPLEEMTAGDRLFLTNLEERIKQRIVGQDEAVAKTVAAVKKSRAGLNDPNRPLAVLLFAGPTGVGKTQLAKTLADLLFGSSNHLISFDLSAYSEAHSVARLLGAPPGYAGCDEEGLLAAAMRRTPFSVLLFDEVEKAHPRVFDALLPVLDEGRLKDSRGREVSFRNAIIILTSNIGAGRLRRTASTDKLSAELMDEFRTHFRPEFINRLDDIVPFFPLLFEDVRVVLRHALAELHGRLKERRVRLHVYQDAYEYLAREGYSEAFGARELRRAVERLVVAPMSDWLLEGKCKEGDTVDILMHNGALVLRKGQAETAASRTKA